MTLKDLERTLNTQGGHLSGVYKITRKSDGRVYIGQSECITARILQHIKNIREGNSEKIDGAIRAEGWENFVYEVELALPELNTEQLWAAESTYIAKYDSYANGFNKTKGNHIGKYDHACFIRKNVVSAEVTKFIRDHFKLSYFNKQVLLIGFFSDQFVNALKYFDCNVTIINKIFEDSRDFGNYIIEEIEHYKNMKFDLIIANPPYGKVGANIAKTIIDSISYTEFINLLPANDYKRNDTKDLYRYVDLDSMISLQDAFSDAAVTTHIARLVKTPNMTITPEEFEIENYATPCLKKYFYVTRSRKHYAIDNTGELHKIKNPDANYTFFLNGRDINHKHLPWKNGRYTEESLTYQWNINKITYAEATKYSQPSAIARGEVYFYGNTITFHTTTEKDNFTNFVYNNRLFINSLFAAVQADGRFVLGKMFPKVDWSRAWTVEEVLLDYGYTPEEIVEVIAAVNNLETESDE